MKDQVLKACQHILIPIVRLLIRSGASWAEFAELGKQVFVDVARRDYGLQGRPTNTARVSMMTGLSRREVTRVRDSLAVGAASSVPAASRISQVLTGWHVDGDFQEPDGRPAVLPQGGEQRSLDALLNRYAGDMPHGALIKEMQHLGLIVADADGFQVTARDYIRSPADPDMLRQAGVALHDHAQTVVHNVDANRRDPARFERMATRIEVDPADAEAFKAVLAQKGQALLEEMDQWLAERESSRGNRKHTIAHKETRTKVRTGLGVYLIYDETTGTHEDD